MCFTNSNACDTHYDCSRGVVGTIRFVSERCRMKTYRLAERLNEVVCVCFYPIRQILPSYLECGTYGGRERCAQSFGGET